MKRLTITYNGMTLFDDSVDQVMWAEDELGMKVEGRKKKAAAGQPSGQGLIDLLTSASRAKTQSVIEDKRRQKPVEETVAESVVDIA